MGYHAALNGILTMRAVGPVAGRGAQAPTAGGFRNFTPLICQPFSVATI